MWKNILIEISCNCDVVSCSCNVIEISCSAMEAKFIALDTASIEAEWFKNFLNGIPILPKPMPPISLHYDSQATIAKAKSKNYNEKRRRLKMRHKLVKHLISHAVISLVFVRSENNIADPLTKGLAR